ncbi:MAG: hypothetical protein ACYS0E_12720 [Planctomycetota bacterium]
MSRSRRRLPFGVILAAAIVVVLIPTLTPDDWFPADKTTRDLVLAGVMIGVLALILGGWLLFGGKDEG